MCLNYMHFLWEFFFPLTLPFSCLVVLSYSNLFVFVLSYCIVFYYHSLNACLFSKERQNGYGYRWEIHGKMERNWEEQGERRPRNHNTLCEKKSIYNKK